MGDPVRGPCRGVAFLPPIERDNRDVIFPSGGRVLGVFTVLDNDVDPNNGRNIFVVVIP